MTGPHRARPIPGAAPRFSVQDLTLRTGECPICAARVLWAFDRTERADGSTWHAPLEPEPLHELDVRPHVAVLMSSTGEASVVSPVVHRRHVCPPEVVRELLERIGSLGYYTAEVLAVSCPVRMCGAAPGLLCLSPRREALPRPHGGRVVVSRGEELEDPAFS